eukprot:gnl/TRDRNA2_/TRDRNA2_163041_c0_seq1.p1 gnl/TRDRNA2_/TRDRNA2_163041_c0~~gnl/TRDRNA2_/TRDRNA2_163041_c0_seq1.p1  ORF type:complete len:548 (-),score=63.51 gnl/TRDRNA2_/TRDRNA2_163041_c0_seq1:370-1893(-)
MLPTAKAREQQKDKGYPYDSLIASTQAECYSRLVRDANCCLDEDIFTGLERKIVNRPGTEWNCTSDTCYDDKKGLRGKGLMWLPHGADCSTPRILYIHGGSWEYGSPFTTGYPAFTSRLAGLTGAVVYIPDYPLVPVGNFSSILHSSLDALKWFARVGPGAKGGGDCAGPMPPMFIGGDSSGGGTALSTMLKILESPTLGPFDGKERLAGGFFFSPWTNLKCNTPDYYHNAFSGIVDRSIMHNAYIGDLLFRGRPLKNSANFNANAQEYVAGDQELLTDPIASPLYAEMESWKGVPPLYFAVGGSESIQGDSVLLAQRMAHHGVEVQLDIYQGMWHDFPMYSEGCGTGVTLWQGISAQLRMSTFVKVVASTGKPPCSTHPGNKGSSPYTVFHYNTPGKNEEWFPKEQSPCEGDAPQTLESDTGSASVVQQEAMASNYSIGPLGAASYPSEMPGGVQLRFAIVMLTGTLLALDNVRLRWRNAVLQGITQPKLDEGFLEAASPPISTVQ